MYRHCNVGTFHRRLCQCTHSVRLAADVELQLHLLLLLETVPLPRQPTALVYIGKRLELVPGSSNLSLNSYWSRKA